MFENGSLWHSWFSHCATCWKVEGSIPNGVIGIFHVLNPSGCSVSVRLTHPLTEMSTRDVFWMVNVAGE